MRGLEATTGDKIIDTLSENGVTSENKTIHIPLPSSPFKVGLFEICCSLLQFCKTQAPFQLFGISFILRVIKEACMAEQLIPGKLDLEVRGSNLARRVVSLDRELYSTLSPSSPRCTNGYRRHTAGG